MIDDFRFERFDKARHKRTAFDCGVRELNEYLRTVLNQHSKRGLTSGYVLATPDGTIAGYFTLCAARINVGVLPRETRFRTTMPLPSILLGRLAVDNAYRSRGLGAAILARALEVAVVTSETVAAAVIEVNAKDEPARSFYARFGFQSLPDDALHMYLSMEHARAMVRSYKPPRE